MATAEDAGLFVCRAQNGEGLAEEGVEVVLEGGAFPQASVSETELTAVEGQSVSMHCQASGKQPSPTHPSPDIRSFSESLQSVL